MVKHYSRRMLSFFAFFLISASFVFAQNGISVQGVVSDDVGPMQGVTVVVKGDQTAWAITDLDGKYSLTVPSKTSVLTFSFLGYEDKEIEVGNKTTINVRMVSAVTALDDVVVVGYGVQKKSHLTGAVAKLDGDVLADRPVSDIATALQGQIPGLYINNNTSEVGVSPDIQVRGSASISAGSSPLVIIDGFPVPDGLSTLNPSDISSIEVLKDAASAAIYGSRAANGVIMVTTKSGASSKPQYNLKVTQGFKYAYELHDLYSYTEYYNLLKQEEAWGGGDVSQQIISGAWLEENIGSTDWQQQALRDFANSTNVQFSLQGGNDKIRHFTSASYINDQGVMKQNKVEKLTFRSKITADLSKYVEFGTNVSANYSITHRPKNNFTDFYRTPSFLPVMHNAWSTALTGYTGFAHGHNFYNIVAPTGEVDDYGNPIFTDPQKPFSTSNQNPLSVMHNTFRSSENFQGLANMYLRVKLAKGLYLKTSNGANFRYRPDYYYGNADAVRTGAQSEATFNSMLYVDLLSENTLTYNRTFGKHEIDGLLGFTAQSTRVEHVALHAQGFATDDIHTLNAGTIFNLASDGDTNGLGDGTGTFRFPDVILESYLSRFAYNYAGKYLLSASIRLDRSSLFSEGNRNAWFPSVSLGWRISEEGFMKTQDLVSNLKLRASYGVTGNNDIDYYAALEVLTSANYPLGSGNGDLIQGAANASETLANNDITWEQTDEYNFGLDLGLWNNRLSLTADVFNSTTRSLLFAQATQSFTGFTSYWNNIGRVRNVGAEFQLNGYQFQNTNFTWSTNFNLSLYRNKILDLGGEYELKASGERNEIYVARVGEPLNQFFGFKTDGVWNSLEEIEANPHTSSDVPGSLRIVDTNKDGKITDADRVALGDPNPTFTWGMTNNFKVYDFDISILFQGVEGATVLNGDIYYNETHKYNKAYMDGRWVSESHPGDGQTPYMKTGYDLMLTDQPLQDASYLCLRDLTVGYTLPKQYARKVGLQSLRLYATGSNLWYWWRDDYKGINPEARYTSGYYNTPLISGYQRGAFPLTSSIVFGIDLNF